MKQLSMQLGDMEHQPPKSYKGIYAMHKYWSKKPPDLVSNYISRFSSPGDVVMDPFCGSGVTIIESVRMRRKGLGFDINPIAVFLTEMGLERVDVEELQRSYDELKARAKPIINKLYKTTCPKCAKDDALATHYIWEDGQISEVWVSCNGCRSSKVTKTPDKRDLQTIDSLDIPAERYLQNCLIENSRINAKSGMKISDLFTKRALHALTFLLEEIHQIDDVIVRNAMKLCFSASLPQTSRMVFVIRRRGKTAGDSVNPKAEVGSWVIGYWVPSEHFEINVWRCFENRFRRILRGKKEIADLIPIRSTAHTSFEQFVTESNGYYVGLGNASKLPVETESVDYVFTDPPHGNRIPYLELSLMWNSWLGHDNIDWENEIVVSQAKERRKDNCDYRIRLSAAIREIWRVLKPDKCMSIAFNSLDDKTWLSLLNSCTQTGFKLTEIRPMEYSARSVVQDNRRNALKTDFVLTFRKQTPNVPEELLLHENRKDIRDIIRDYLNGLSGECVETYEILNHVLVLQARRGRYIPVKTLLNVLNKEFRYIDFSWQI
ncbi:MAG: DNA methyltransferase [Chloroflexota bacterium]|nr:DNA methyltransferase [Chloroflexota bacterium]